jgi:integrase
MKLDQLGSKVYLSTGTGILYLPGTIYLNEKYKNPHTRCLIARAIRLWICFADAFSIDLASRAIEGTWLTETEKKSLLHLSFRTIEEVELMNHHAIRTVASVVKKNRSQHISNIVQPNTAHQQIVRITDFLNWFHQKILEPRMSAGSSVTTTLRSLVSTCAAELKNGIGGTKSMHPHRIRSMPAEQFLELYSQVYLHPEKIFCTKSGKPSRNLLRDRSMILLACEGMRPGAIGNTALKDFQWAGSGNTGHVHIRDNSARRTKDLSTNTPVQKGTSSIQNYNSEFVLAIWPTTAQAIKDYIDNERQSIITRTLRNRSEGFLHLADHGGPISDRKTIERVFKQAGERLKDLGLLSKSANDPYLEGEYYSFDAYLLRHSAASLFYSRKIHDMSSDTVSDSMKDRFGWSMKSTMPNLYARRAISDLASLTINDWLNSLQSVAKETNKPHEK